MKPKTQRERIIDKLNADGEITSVWAVHNFIYRLSERIRELQEEGWEFAKAFVEVDGKKTHTYRYVVLTRPTLPTIEWAKAGDKLPI